MTTPFTAASPTFKAFEPHPWLRGGHLQTLAGHLFESVKPPEAFDVLRVPLPDGDELHLHIDKASPSPLGELTTKKPVVLLMHGLGGCSESTYNLRISAQLRHRGYEVVRFNHRGCGREAAHLAKGIYHAARIEDLECTLKALSLARPGRPLLAVAFSLSANLLLRYLGESTRAVPALKGAMAVSPPVDLELCSLALNQLSNKYMDVYYTRRLVRTARKRESLFPDLKPAVFPKGLDLRLFDEIYTAPQAGFKNRDHYYQSASAKNVVQRIAIPTLVLNAADDPIIPKESFVSARFSSSCEVRHEISGGHMGFISDKKTPLGDRRWMDHAVVNWVESMST